MLTGFSMIGLCDRKTERSVSILRLLDSGSHGSSSSVSPISCLLLVEIEHADERGIASPVHAVEVLPEDGRRQAVEQ